MSEPAIVIDRLSKSFRGQTVVDEVGLTIEPGQVLGLIGPNGAGKSTTIKMLIGQLRPDRGEARVLGLDPIRNAVAMKRLIGYVPERHCVYPWMRVGQAIGFTRSFYPTWDDGFCQSLVDTFELPLGRKVRQLSKGMTAKLSLLLAIAHRPTVLILDEPMSGVDAVVRDEFFDGLLQTIGEQRCSVLFSSHTLADVQRIADAVGLIYEGRLLAHRPVDEMLRSIRRLRGVLHDGQAPPNPPPHTIHQRRDGREWIVTVDRYEDGVLESLHQTRRFTHLEAEGLGLEEIFKDYVKGRRSA